MRLTRSIQRLFGSHMMPALFGAALVALSGCGPKVANTGTSPLTQPKKAPASVAAQAVSPTGTNERPQSVFSSNPSEAKDPFFPASARFQQKIADKGETKPGSAPADVAALLTRGFQGTFMTQSDRVALVNNTILEPGKNAEIAVGMNGKAQQVKVHCVQVTRNTATVTVAGRAEPIVLTLQTRGTSQ